MTTTDHANNVKAALKTIQDVIGEINNSETKAEVTAALNKIGPALTTVQDELRATVDAAFTADTAEDDDAEDQARDAATLARQTATNARTLGDEKKRNLTK